MINYRLIHFSFFSFSVFNQIKVVISSYEYPKMTFALKKLHKHKFTLKLINYKLTMKSGFIQRFLRNFSEFCRQDTNLPRLIPAHTLESQIPPSWIPVLADMSLEPIGTEIRIPVQIILGTIPVSSGQLKIARKVVYYFYYN